MQPHKIVSQSEWIAARKAFLESEKRFTRARDELSKQRRELPWVRVDKDYVFEGPNGKTTLAELFDGRSQLIVYHFMLGPDWPEGCKSCSYLSDHWDGATIHLAHRDVTFLCISRAPYDQIAAFKKRMGWRFNWVSSFGNDFNRDFHVSFTKDEMDGKKAYYNYEPRGFPVAEAPGASVFFKNDKSEVFHTYSTYGRGLDILVGTYNLLDLVPKGRDEDELKMSMAWVRHHDRYDDAAPDQAAAAQQPIVKASCCG